MIFVKLEVALPEMLLNLLFNRSSHVIAANELNPEERVDRAPEKTQAVKRPAIYQRIK